MDGLGISENTRVTLNFALLLEDNSEIDSNFGKKPAVFVIGDGSLLPGFERAMFGLCSGDEAVLTIAPEDGFGQPNDNNIQTVQRELFDDKTELKLGMAFYFADAANGELPGVVVDFNDKEVSVDFNHPLAGRTIKFKVSIHNVEAAKLH